MSGQVQTPVAAPSKQLSPVLTERAAGFAPDDVGIMDEKIKNKNNRVFRDVVMRQLVTIYSRFERR